MKTHILLQIILTVFLGTLTEAGADVLISIAQRNQSSDISTEELCQMVHGGLNVLSTVNTTCIKLDNEVTEALDVTAEKTRGDYAYHVQVRNYAASLRVIIQHWKRADDTEVNQTQFNIRKDGKGKWRGALINLSQNLMHYDANKDLYKGDLLKSLITESKRVGLDGSGNFVDRITNKIMSMQEALTIYETEYPTNRGKLLAGAEFGAIFGYYTYKYYQNHKNRLDWDYGFFDGLKLKLSGEAVRFDDNDRSVNTGHVSAGTGYYLVCRGNGYTALESFLCNVAASSVWEFLIEYKEVVSINDIITTEVGGSFVGEVFHRFSCSLKNNPSKALRALGQVFDPFGEINKWMNGDNPTTAQCDGDNSVTVGGGRRDGNAVGIWSLDSEVYSLPTEERTGAVSVLIPSVYQSQLAFSSERSAAGQETLQFLAQMGYLALYKHDLKRDKNDELNGYQIMISPAGGTEIVERNYDNKDFFVNVHVIGARVQMSGFYKGREFKATMSIYQDFALVSSYSLSAYRASNPSPEVLQGVIQRDDYYYGSGQSVFSNVEFKGKRWYVGMYYRHTDIDIIRGRDRYQEHITHDLRMGDVFEQRRATVGFNLTRRLRLEGVLEKERRAGFVEGGFAKSKSFNRVIGRLRIRF